MLTDLSRTLKEARGVPAYSDEMVNPPSWWVIIGALARWGVALGFLIWLISALGISALGII